MPVVSTVRAGWRQSRVLIAETRFPYGCEVELRVLLFLGKQRVDPVARYNKGYMGVPVGHT